MPNTLAIYAFGSRISGGARRDSDLDLAILVSGFADPNVLFELTSPLAQIAGCEVDLVDMRAASTVMQYQILTTGKRWFAADAQADFFEVAVFSEKVALDEARAPLLADIAARGSVHGR